MLVDLDGLELYNLTAEQIAEVDTIFEAAICEAGYSVEVDPGTGLAISDCPDEVWVKACNVVRRYLKAPEFPDVETYQKWEEKHNAG